MSSVSGGLDPAAVGHHGEGRPVVAADDLRVEG
jgi:hypothetical protein